MHASDRVMVTGGSGWFGRTAVALLWHAFGDEWVRRQVLATASATRAIDVLGCGRHEVRLVDPVEVADFAPTLIINCAFPTRDRVAGMGLGPYVALARTLTRSFLEYSELPSVQRVVTFSSGAAVPSSAYPADLEVNPYGVLKAHEERETLGLAQRTGINARVCRVWAVSGPHVQHPRNYAFSQFIVQAREAGRIRVAADRPVIRAYSSVDDALAVTLAAVSTGSGLFDTGGQRIELGELATQVATVLGGVPDRAFHARPDSPGRPVLGTGSRLATDLPGSRPGPRVVGRTDRLRRRRRGLLDVTGVAAAVGCHTDLVAG